MKKPEIKVNAVQIKWVDSSSIYGWRPPSSDSACEIRSIGIVVSQDKHNMTISTSKSESGNFMDQLTIPKQAIRSVRKIKL